MQRTIQIQIARVRVSNLMVLEMMMFLVSLKIGLSSGPLIGAEVLKS